MAAGRRSARLLATAAAAAAVLATPASAAPPPYRDTRLPFGERAADLVARMTLDEKAQQLGTTNAQAIPRLGVQQYAYWSEAQHGVSAFWGGDWYGGSEYSGGVNNPIPATSFPTNLATSMSWDPGLMQRETDAISDEARGFLDRSLFDDDHNDLGPKASDYGSLFYFNPTINIDRDPRWGRTDEAFGEDPFLVGTMATAYVHGFQGQRADGSLRGRYLKAVATAKHFALNNVEKDRTAVSSNTDEATIRDYYTPHFRRVVEQGRVSGLMSSYNAVNGTPAVANSLLLNVLARRTWGHAGYVTSDCGAVATTYRRPDQPIGVPGTALYFLGHDWAPPGWTTNHGGDEAALWTRKSDLRTIRGQAGGEAFALRAGTDVNCLGEDGAPGQPPVGDIGSNLSGKENRIDYVREAIASGALGEDVIDRALVRLFTLRMETGEFDPRARQPYTRIHKSVIESRAHRELAGEVAKRSLVLLKNRPPRAGARPLLPADPRGLHRVVILGDQAGKVFLGGYSGKPHERISLRQALTNQVRKVNPGAAVTYDDAGSSSTSSSPVALSAETRDAIRHADLVVVMVGTDENTNAEGADRDSVAMPGNYDSLVHQAAAVGNPRIALVVQAGGMVALGPVEHEVRSILFSAPAGQRQGRAFAAALLGRVNPSGRLSFTWYRGDRQLPSMSDYDLAPRRTGGLGRTYEYFAGVPQYRFGFGLGYTTFRWTGIHTDRRQVDANNAIKVKVRIRNTGRRVGATVVQVYARSPKVSGRDVPLRRLVGFRKTRELAPGASQRVTISVPIADTLRLWDAAARRSVVYPGRWTFEVSGSAGERLHQLPVRITGRIARTVRHLTVQPPKSTLKVGEALSLRAKNHWLQGLGPVGTPARAADIITAVRQDDTFVDLSHAPLRFTSSSPTVVRVDGNGLVKGIRPGTATVSVSFAGSTARAVFAVR
ncbi:MAG: glycoside hydrolase family 3 C-terminal domain-containing protein [Thermoleophilaceae bacterium]